MGRGDPAEGLACFDEEEQIARQRGDDLALARALAKRGISLAIRGDTGEALDAYRTCEQIARAHADRLILSNVLYNRGNIHLSRQEHADALDCFDESERIARELGHRQTIVAVLNARGNLHTRHRRYADALGCYAECELLAREIGDNPAIAAAVRNCGDIHLNRGEFADALACFCEHERIARELGHRRSVAIAVGKRGTVLSQCSEYVQALELLHQADMEHRTIGAPFERIYLLKYMAEALRELAECPGEMPAILPKYVDDAEPENWRKAALRSARLRAGESRDISEAMGDSTMIPGTEIVLALITAAEGDREAATNVLLTMLDEITEDADRADLHYWLWKISPDRTADRDAALELYNHLVSTGDHYLDRKRRDELTLAACELSASPS